MLRKYIVRCVVWIFKRSDISDQERAHLANAMLDKLGALPFYDIISTNDDGQLLVAGKVCDREKVLSLRNAAKSALINPVELLIEEQILSEASRFGIAQSTSLSQIIFAKAANWYEQQRRKHIEFLANFGGNIGSDSDA